MTIKFIETRVGDILKLTGQGAPGFAELGDLLRVLAVFKETALVENRDGHKCEFVFNCGADRLETTEWRDDFPAEEAAPRPQEEG